MIEKREMHQGIKEGIEEIIKETMNNERFIFNLRKFSILIHSGLGALGFSLLQKHNEELIVLFNCLLIN
jgi:hypothetical protein